MNTYTKIIRGVLLCLMLIGSHTLAQAQRFSDKFMEVAESKVTSMVTVNGEVINVLKKKEADPGLRAFLNELTFLCVITMEKDAKTISTYYDMAQSLLKNGKGYESLLWLKEGDQQVLIAVLGRDERNKAKEIVMLSINGEQFTVVDLTGSITVDKLSTLAASIKKSMQNL